MKDEDWLPGLPPWAWALVVVGLVLAGQASGAEPGDTVDWGPTMGQPYRLYSPVNPPVYEPLAPGQSGSGFYDPLPSRGPVTPTVKDDWTSPTVIDRRTRKPRQYPKW